MAEICWVVSCLVLAFVVQLFLPVRVANRAIGYLITIVFCAILSAFWDFIFAEPHGWLNRSPFMNRVVVFNPFLVFFSIAVGGTVWALFPLLPLKDTSAGAQSLRSWPFFIVPVSVSVSLGLLVFGLEFLHPEPDFQYAFQLIINIVAIGSAIGVLSFSVSSIRFLIVNWRSKGIACSKN